MNPETESLSPIYSIVVGSTLLAIAWGIIFKDMLEYQVNQWYANRETQPKVNYQKTNILMTYIGLSLFVLVSVSSSFAVFGFSYAVALIMAAIVVIPTALLVWLQLGSMLQLLVEGGSEAIDIDSYGAGKKFDVQAPAQDP
ncbi:MAG: hypothetical protein VKL39_19575 [Leptolyngbyaceae bacterium]|nr:hypothetical protein [Leptolyngbyaceae bacterium]